MDQKELALALVELTGSLEPGQGSNAAELQAARLDLAQALLAGQSIEMIRNDASQPLSAVAALHQTTVQRLPGEFLSRIEDLCAAVVSDISNGPSDSPLTLAFLRTTPIQSSLDSSIPPWARGMKITHSRGPFLGPGGLQIWVDSIQTVKLIPFVRDPGNDLFALFPIDISAPGNTARHVSLGKGSVWIVARKLANNSPDSAFAGLRISGGTLDLSENLVIIGQEVHIPRSALCTLTVNLDLPSVPPLVNGPGADATRAIANLPGSVTIEFTPGGSRITSLPDLSAAIYGTTLNLKKNAATPQYESKTQEILIPCDVTPSQFTVTQHLSALFSPSKSASITGAAWALQVTITPPSHLGEAAGAGAVTVSLSEGIAARWTGLNAEVSFQTTILHLIPGQLAVLSTVQGKPLTQTFKLWDEMPVGGKPRSSAIEFQYPKLFDLIYFSVTGIELIQLSGAAVAHLDRPLRADGTRFAIQSPSAILGIILTSIGQRVVLSGTIPPAKQTQPLAIALENALLKVLPPEKLFLNGSLQNDTVNLGTLSLSFALRSILPTLPDPYAANFSARRVGASDAQIGLLGAAVNWSAPDQPQLTFSLAIGTSAQAENSRSFALLDANATNTASAIGQGVLALLDVSSNSDQLGVALLSRGNSGIGIDNLALAALTRSLAIFTVPDVSWEPMASDPPTPSQPDFPVPLPPGDGGATVLSFPIETPTAYLSPIEPVPLLTHYISSVNTENMPVTADFSLPFGLRAHVKVYELMKLKGEFQLNQPVFGNSLAGGLQITMRPPHPTAEDAMFQDESYTEIVPPFTTPPPTPPYVDEGYGVDVLGVSIAAIFDGDFNLRGQRQGVPLKRIDLSGYGASIFSEWSDSYSAPPKISKVQFDTFVGRTAYEVVQAASILYPWAVQVVRTITLERQAAGWVFRRDGGWQAVTTGEFHFPTSSGILDSNVHPGAVPGVFNVRRIRENGVISVMGVTYRRVLFDADVKINPNIAVIAGGFRDAAGNTFVPSKDMAGYIQLSPDGQPATLPQLTALLSMSGPLGGPIACTVNIGVADPNAPGAQMRGTSVDVSITDNGPNPALVASLRGTPLLPRDGSWSLGRQNRTQSAPSPLDPLFPVPLVQNRTDPSAWHLADPSDVLQLGTPFTQYGLLQSTGTQKLFFARPQIPQGQATIAIPQPPHLADVGALLNATGIFPDLNQALQFDSPQTLGVSGDGLALVHPPFTINSPPRTLIDFDVVKVLVNYLDENNSPTLALVEIDPTKNPRWQISLTRLRFDVIFTPLSSDPILQIYGTARADSNTAPTITNLNVVYGGILKPVETLFSNLQFLAAFLPGGIGAGLDVSFSQGKLTIRDSFALPQLPLGIGEITDVALDLGMTLQLSPQALEFTAGIGSEQKPFHWLVSPLSGTGVIQVGAKNGDLALLIQGGLGLGLSIDVGIASGAASIVLALQVDTSISPLNITGILTGQASVDVLEGLASASLTLSAGLGIAPDLTLPPNPVQWPPPSSITLPSETITLTASVGVGIHISICWVVDVDFDGYWQFSQSITTPSVTVPF